MRLFIADADSSVRIALQLYLQQEPGMYVIGIASESEGLSTQLAISRTDVLLLDWHLPGAAIQDMLSAIQGLEPSPKIAVLSIRPEDREPAMSAGADAFISKNELPSILIEVVRSFGKI